MSINRILKPLGVIFSALTLYSLALPVFSTHITDGEACNMVVKGYNLVEFSPWGSMILIVPLVMLGLMLGKLKSSIQTIGLLSLFIINGAALCSATSDAHDWMSEIATGFVKPHMSHLIYALLFFIATVCFWASCNFSTNIKSLKSLFSKEAPLKVETVDHRKEKFFWCNKPYNFAKYKGNGDVTTGESILCFATNEGYFAGLNDGDPEEYFNIEALEGDVAVGFVMGTMPTGIYGSFYDGQEFLNDLNMIVDICPFDEIYIGEAELKIPDKDGSFTCGDVFVFPHDPNNIRVGSVCGLEDPPAIGAAVMQGEKLIAFVTEYDEEKHEYKCIAAELIAIDLCRKIYEHRVFKSMQERKINEKQRKVYE